MRISPFKGLFSVAKDKANIPNNEADTTPKPRKLQFQPHTLPVYIGLLVLLLALPASMLSVKHRQDIRKKASQRTFQYDKNAPHEPGELIIKYRKDLKIQTNPDINQHVHSFEINDIKEGMPVTTKNNLTAAGVRKIDLVFSDAKLPTEQSRPSQVLDLLGIDYKYDPHGTTYRLEVPQNADLEKVMNLLGKDPNVEYVQPNYIFKTTAVPSDPLYGQMWAMPKIEAPSAWDIGTGSNSVKVAVIDTGVDLNHPDLQGNLITGRNFINTSSSPQDDHGHGTHVAGTAGAVGNNSVGVTGVSWAVQIMPLKVLSSSGTGSETAIAEALRYAADNGVRVVNMSLVMNSQFIPQAMQDAVTYAASKGVIMVGGAGNDNANMSTYYPAAFPDVIAVAATDQQDAKASFSNFGDKIAVAAPGVGILSTMSTPNVLAPCSGQTYCSISGTSMATPHVAGLIALLLSKNSSLTQSQVLNYLTSTAQDLGSFGKDPHFGYGRINALRAMQAVTNGSPPPSTSPTVPPSPSASPTVPPSGSPTTSPSPSPTVTTPENLANQLAQACGGNPIITKRLSQTSTGGSDWASYTAKYGGQNFNPIGELFIYIGGSAGCTVTLPSETLNLNPGWNKVNVTTASATVQLRQVEVQKSKGILDLLF